MHTQTHIQGENVDLFLDLHTSVTSIGSFVEGKKFEDVFRMEKHLLLPKLLAKITPDFQAESCIYANEPLRPGTPIRSGPKRRLIPASAINRCNRLSLPLCLLVGAGTQGRGIDSE